MATEKMAMENWAKGKCGHKKWKGKKKGNKKLMWKITSTEKGAMENMAMENWTRNLGNQKLGNENGPVGKRATQN